MTTTTIRTTTTITAATTTPTKAAIGNAESFNSFPPKTTFIDSTKQTWFDLKPCAITLNQCNCTMHRRYLWGHDGDSVRSLHWSDVTKLVYLSLFVVAVTIFNFSFHFSCYCQFKYLRNFSWQKKYNYNYDCISINWSSELLLHAWCSEDAADLCDDVTDMSAADRCQKIGDCPAWILWLTQHNL